MGVRSTLHRVNNYKKKFTPLSSKYTVMFFSRSDSYDDILISSQYLILEINEQLILKVILYYFNKELWAQLHEYLCTAAGIDLNSSTIVSVHGSRY